ncbi:MAG: hypothetical protein QM619_01765 [Micropruina sp.]|uniref:hypothetical protein n=1 Tax=Micropruina sp. TaxID=2737536 RepID=UPI0039E3A8E7
MPRFPAASRSDHRSFCRIEEWSEVQRGTGGGVRHHLTFELNLPDGRILRTHISRPPPARKTYGAGLWNTILRSQLDVSEEEFWDCVQRKVKPNRGIPQLPARTIPAGVVTLLINLGVPEATILAMSREEAIATLNELLSKPAP